MNKKATLSMEKRYGYRDSISLKVVHRYPRFCNLAYSNFSKAWKLVAEELNFPSEEKMRPDDSLDLIILINNTSLFLAQYEDEYEILQAISVDAFHDGIDNRIELKTIADLVLHLSKYV